MNTDERCAADVARQRDQDDHVGLPRLRIMHARIVKDLAMPDSRIGDMDNRADPDRRNPERHEYPALPHAKKMRLYPKAQGPGICIPPHITTPINDFPVTPAPDTQANKDRFAYWSKTKKGKKALR